MPNTNQKSPPRGQPKRPFSRPILYITSVNIEGLSSNKDNLLEEMCIKNECDILVLQETHRDEHSNRPNLKNMKLVIERPHNKYGSAILTKPNLKIISTAKTEINDIEILTIELEHCTVTSIYKPPNADFQFTEPANFRNKKHHIVIGDFNCHSTSWGYNRTDKNGEELETWIDQNDFRLVHDTKLPSSFNSGRWRKGSNPDNIFVSSSLFQQCRKIVEDHIPHSQHRGISCQITAVINADLQPFKRRFNFKKAKWDSFTGDLDESIKNLEPSIKSYDTFIEIVKKVSRRHIPRGCTTEYVSGLNEDSKSILKEYQDLFDSDPFSEDTITAGERLMHALSTSRKDKWCDLLANMDMKQNSRRAWKLVKNLSNDPTKSSTTQCNITNNQIAHQLLLNGKTTTKKKKMKIIRDLESENDMMK